jgi:hypothetical protein
MGFLGEIMPKKTIGDYLKGAWKNYVAPTEEEIKSGEGKKERNLTYPPNQPPEYVNVGGNPRTRKLTLVQCRQTAEQCALFMKGARKKAMDSSRAWHKIDTFKEDTKPVAYDLKLIHDFEKRTNLKRKWEATRVDSFVYGNGFMLITFENDSKTELHDPPAKGSYPYKAEIMNAEYIKELGYCDKNKEMWKKKGIKHFRYVNSKTADDYWIHPDRIIHMPNDPLSYREFGNSTVNLLRNILKSIINIDIACGETIAWFAHGVFDTIIQGMKDPERKEWEAIHKKHPGAYIHDETVELKAIEPKAINPQPFYDYLILKVAAGFRMPTHVLTGIEVGRVTGAEIGFQDYYKDVRDDQDLLYTPLLERLYSQILNGHKVGDKPRQWKYRIVWNPIYIDELAEAEIMRIRVESAEKAYNGTKGVGGFVDQEESRRIFNLGQIELDETKKIKPRPPLEPSKPPTKPVAKDDDDDDEESADVTWKKLDLVTRAMIEARKKQAEKERKIGEEVLKEQNAKNRS